ncbi:MAG: hypothetical protein ABL977_16075, partial [Candidatus Eisenbacteria bacterium]
MPRMRRSSVLVSSWLALVAFSPVFAAAPAAAARPSGGSQPGPLLPLSRLLAPATNQAPLLSPDGRWLSFLR